MQRRSLLLIGVALLTTGCTANNEHLLYKEVERVVPWAIPAGQTLMTIADAENALRGIGFHCRPDTRGRDCVRSRSYGVVATCVQRVILVPTSDQVFLHDYYIPRIP